MFDIHPFGRPLTRAAFARLDLLIALFLALLVLLLLSIAPAHAQSTIFLTEKNGGIAFPILPPNRATGGPAKIDNTDIGTTTPGKGNFSQISSGAGLPTIASGACGTTTNGAVVAGSTNQSFKITIGAVATTSCTISFSATLSPIPKACVFSPMNAAAIGAGTLPFIAAPSATGVVFSGAVLASTNWAFLCL